MKNKTCLALSACFLIQTVPLQPGGASPSPAPEHRLDSARELFNGKNFAQMFPSDADAGDYTHFIYQQTKSRLPNRWKFQAQKLAEVIIDESNRYKMDPLFLMAVMMHESQFRPDALGRHGEIGLMQIKPATASSLSFSRTGKLTSVKRMRELLRDPAFNVRCGAAYLADLRASFRNQHRLYLAAYNMGAKALRHRLRSPGVPSQYSDKVLANYFSLALAYSRLSSLEKQTLVASTH